jgi:hypothetical protein
VAFENHAVRFDRHDEAGFDEQVAGFEGVFGHAFLLFSRHPRRFQQPNGWSRGDPVTFALRTQHQQQSRWVPACAGMTILKRRRKRAQPSFDA